MACGARVAIQDIVAAVSEMAVGLLISTMSVMALTRHSSSSLVPTSNVTVTGDLKMQSPRLLRVRAPEYPIIEPIIADTNQE